MFVIFDDILNREKIGDICNNPSCSIGSFDKKHDKSLNCGTTADTDNIKDSKIIILGNIILINIIMNLNFQFLFGVFVLKFNTKRYMIKLLFVVFSFHVFLSLVVLS